MVRKGEVMDFERLMLGSPIRKRPGPRPCEHSRAALSRCERFSCHLRARRSSFCSLPGQNEFHLQATDLRQRVDAKARQIAGGAKVDGLKARAAIVFAFLLLAGKLAQKADLLLRDANIDAAVDWAWHRFIHGLRGAHARLYPVIRGQPLGHKSWQEDVSLSQLFDNARFHNETITQPTGTWCHNAGRHKIPDATPIYADR
jgi:hypothetical protein